MARIKPPKGMEVPPHATGTDMYTPEIANNIIDAVAEGVSLMTIVRWDGYPSWRVIWKWEQANRDGFGDRLRMAKMSRANKWAEETIGIADDGSLEPHDKKVRIETRLKVAAMCDARLAPKNSTEHSGEIKLTIRKMGEHD